MHLKSLVDQILIQHSTSNKRNAVETMSINEASHKDTDKNISANIQSLGCVTKKNINHI